MNWEDTPVLPNKNLLNRCVVPFFFSIIANQYVKKQARSKFWYNNIPRKVERLEVSLKRLTKWPDTCPLGFYDLCSSLVCNHLKHALSLTSVVAFFYFPVRSEETLEEDRILRPNTDRRKLHYLFKKIINEIFHLSWLLLLKQVRFGGEMH